MYGPTSIEFLSSNHGGLRRCPLVNTALTLWWRLCERASISLACFFAIKCFAARAKPGTEETELIAMLSISRRNFITLGAGLFATGALAGCGGSSAEGSSSSEGGSSAANGTYKIGVLQLTEHGALDQTNKGLDRKSVV